VRPAPRVPERIAERPAAPAVEPKALPAPAADSAAPLAAKDLVELMARLAQVAERNPRDHALLSQIEVLSFTGDAAKVAVRSEGGGGYLVTNPDPVRMLLSRAAGRPVRVALEARETPGVPPPAKRTTVDDAEVRADPLVRRAAELFDASIVAVTRRGAPTQADGDAERAGATEGDERIE
jgi:hypothetical protein